MRSLTPVAAALCLTALAMPLSIAGTNAALTALTAALLWHARRNGRRILSVWASEPALPAVVLYAAAGLIAAAFSVSAHDSLRDAAKDLHRVWAILLLTAAFSLEPEARVAPALAAGFSAAALCGIAQTLFLTLPNGILHRAQAFVHPVVFGGQMCLGLLGGLCVLARPGTLPPRTRSLVAVLTALSGAALILSQTRMALFAAVAALAVAAILEARIRRWILPILAATAAVCAAWELMPVGGRTLSEILRRYDPANPHQMRFALWETAWRIFRDHPWTGAGPGGFRILFPSHHPLPLDGESHWGSAHNLYLHQLAERGLLGASALAGLLGTLSWRAWRAARRGGSTGLWAAASMTAFLCLAITETSFQNEQFATLLLFVWAWGTREVRSPAGDFL